MIDKEEVRKLSREGVSYSEIARRMGCSRAWVGQICAGIHAHKKRRVSLKKGIIFPNLRNWLYTNQVSLLKFCQFMESDFGKGYTHITNALYGRGQFRYEEIKKILFITGMTFEVCFEEEDHEE